MSDLFINRRGRWARRSDGVEVDPDTLEDIMSEETERKTRITRVVAFLGSDGLGYYRTEYGNGQKGATTEGYGSDEQSPSANVMTALGYAVDDYEGLGIPVVVEMPDGTVLSAKSLAEDKAADDGED